MLPNVFANPLARLEPYGMLILVGLLFILPMLGAQLEVDLSIVSRVIASSTDEGNPKSEEHVVDAWKLEVDAGHTHISSILYRKKGILYYRRKPCIEYKDNDNAKSN